MIKLKPLYEIRISGAPTAKMLADMNSYLCKMCPTQSRVKRVKDIDRETGKEYSYLETFYGAYEYDEEVRDKWEEILEKYDHVFSWDEEDFEKIPPKIRTQVYQDMLKFKEKYKI